MDGDSILQKHWSVPAKSKIVEVSYTYPVTFRYYHRDSVGVDLRDLEHCQPNDPHRHSRLIPNATTKTENKGRSDPAGGIPSRALVILTRSNDWKGRFLVPEFALRERHFQTWTLGVCLRGNPEQSQCLTPVRSGKLWELRVPLSERNRPHQTIT